MSLGLTGFIGAEITARSNVGLYHLTLVQSVKRMLSFVG